MVANGHYDFHSTKAINQSCHYQPLLLVLSTITLPLIIPIADYYKCSWLVCNSADYHLVSFGIINHD